jgi:hypothetical protein
MSNEAEINLNHVQSAFVLFLNAVAKLAQKQLVPSQQTRVDPTDSLKSF